MATDMNRAVAGRGQLAPRNRKQKAWYLSPGRKVLRRINAYIARHSLVGNPAFFDPAQFAWTTDLKAGWQQMRAELDHLLLEHAQLPNFQDISRDQTRISQDDRWKTFFLYGYGYRLDDNCARCPQTTRLIEAVPGMKTAFFSILSPGKHIPAHRGPYKGVMRYHLGLMVPEPRHQCRIRVGQRIESWEQGKSMMFDDTYEHEVWNDTSGMRVVLFMDVERPMRFPASLINKAAFGLIKLSPYVQRARKNFLRWQARAKAWKS